MSKIRSKNTKCELELRRALRRLNVKGYRVHVRNLIGTPDIVFSRRNLVVFCDSDFWHGRSKIPQTNRAYWKAKLRRNAERDAKVTRTLRSTGWRVLRLAESDILTDPEGCARRVKGFLSRRAAT
jgi:DNA mismatch endonuclease (patch repair protein)